MSLDENDRIICRVSSYYQEIYFKKFSSYIYFTDSYDGIIITISCFDRDKKIEIPNEFNLKNINISIRNESNRFIMDITGRCTIEDVRCIYIDLKSKSLVKGIDDSEWDFINVC